MRRQLSIGIGLALLGLIGLVTWAQSEMSDEEQATAYFEEITAAPYTDWPFEAGVPEGYYVGQEPHGMILQTFVNEPVVEATGSGAEVFPEGSILVKENHMPGDVDVASMDLQAPVEGFEGNLSDITYMVKQVGYNPDAGDWFWGKMALDGTIVAVGQPGGCIGCHTQVADNDYVFNAKLSN